MSRRLKASEIPRARLVLLSKQPNCALCGIKFTKKHPPVLDHDHSTGYVRDLLCRNCNGIEGKVFNLARRAKRDSTPTDWLQKVIEYYKRHETPQHGGVLHNTFKTEAEKRDERNRKARARRKRNKA